MKTKSKAISGGFKGRMLNPTEQELKDPIFKAIWSITKTWDLNVPQYYDGYCGMNGSHVVLISRAIRNLGVQALYNLQTTKEK